ncbi:hypothetical protein [Leifsonia sp. 22587]|uniref:hypothetical protein n=1 Tax=Leifsonia sp. 22587 TaxID=3453946 RepID=UPI003F86A2B4
MTDRTDDTAVPRDADDLAEAVSHLGNTDTDRLEAVAEHNESLEERLPDDADLPRTHPPAAPSPEQG